MKFEKLRKYFACSVARRKVRFSSSRVRECGLVIQLFDFASSCLVKSCHSEILKFTTCGKSSCACQEVGLYYTIVSKKEHKSDDRSCEVNAGEDDKASIATSRSMRRNRSRESLFPVTSTTSISSLMSTSFVLCRSENCKRIQTVLLLVHNTSVPSIDTLHRVLYCVIPGQVTGSSLFRVGPSIFEYSNEGSAAPRSQHNGTE